jgi:hypothetical protein
LLLNPLVPTADTRGDGPGHAFALWNSAGTEA